MLGATVPPSKRARSVIWSSCLDLGRTVQRFNHARDEDIRWKTGNRLPCRQRTHDRPDRRDEQRGTPGAASGRRRRRWPGGAGRSALWQPWRGLLGVLVHLAEQEPTLADNVGRSLLYATTVAGVGTSRWYSGRPATAAPSPSRTTTGSPPWAAAHAGHLAVVQWLAGNRRVGLPAGQPRVHPALGRGVQRPSLGGAVAGQQQAGRSPSRCPTGKPRC